MRLGRGVGEVSSCPLRTDPSSGITVGWDHSEASPCDEAETGLSTESGFQMGSPGVPGGGQCSVVLNGERQSWL